MSAQSLNVTPATIVGDQLSAAGGPVAVAPSGATNGSSGLVVVPPSGETMLPPIECGGAGRVLIVLTNTGTGTVDRWNLWVSARPGGATALYNINSYANGGWYPQDDLIRGGPTYYVNLAPGQSTYMLLHTAGAIGSVALSCQSSAGTTVQYEASGSGGAQ
jgi:hypothetical protein